MNFAAAPPSAALQPPIAVVGIGALFPGEGNRHSFWQDILAGVDLTRETPPSHWLIEDYFDPDPAKRGKTYARRGAFLPQVAFDPLEYGVPPDLLPSIDTAQLLALIVAGRVVDDALGGHFTHVAKARTSVILGVASSTELVGQMVSSIQRPVWVKALREAGLPESQVGQICDRIEASYANWTEATFPGLLGNVVAGRIANRFDLGGANFVVDAACGSSVAALRLAVQELCCGASDLVITGGVDAINDIFMYMCFSKTPALSPTGDCRPFSVDADGTLLGEGVGMLALRRLADAERDGDRIYAVVRGVGASSDGRAKSIYAPRGEGQSAALRRAYEAAGYAPRTVELMEAHGTGTVAGDAAETQGLRSVFGATAPAPWCALGSVKSQIGHTKAAAGAASLIKAVLALHHKVLPPTIKVSRPNPALGLEGGPFYLNTEARPWVRGPDHLRRASVSSFGFGGSNYHATLEEYDGEGARPARIHPRGAELFLFGVDSLDALDAAASALAARAGRGGDAFAEAARDSQFAFSPSAAHRLALVAADPAALAKAALGLVETLKRGGELGHRAAYASGPAREGGLAFLFPGQGSHQVGMSAAIALQFEPARRVWDLAAADDELAELPRLVFPPPSFDAEARAGQLARLTATDVAQPALGAASLAYLALAEAMGLKPAAFAGHSFGELTALAAAGVYDRATLLRLARVRGLAMREAAQAEAGAMLAVSAEIDSVERLAAEFGLVVANHNARAQAVLAGGEMEIERAAAGCAERKIGARRLPVAAAFHSRAVAGAAPALRAALAATPLCEPRVPVYSNLTAAPHGPVASLPEALARQIESRVRFVEMIENMYADGLRTFVEIGPGDVLAELVRKILEGRDHLAVSLGAEGGTGLARFWSGVGRLATAGVPIDFAPLWEGIRLEPPPAPRAGAILIGGANFGKPYPPAGGASALPPPNPERAADRPPALAAAQAEVAAPALLGVQQALSEAHQAAQKAMSDAHIAYLQASETLIRRLGAEPGAPARAEAPAPSARAFAPAPSPSAPVVAPAPPHAPLAAPDPAALLLAVVAEKTGYPVDMLRLDMDLEADLGIDSIKRVEILAAVQERWPQATDLDASEAGALATLGAILERFAPGLSGAAVPAAAPAWGVATDPAAQLIAIVAEKTGYPVEILNLDMDLEADLGIDSIKRVEILAAAQERFPAARDLDAGELSGLATLRAILERIAGSQSSPASPPPSLSRSRRTLAASPLSGAPLPGFERGCAIALAGGGEALRAAVAERLQQEGLTIAGDGETLHSVVALCGDACENSPEAGLAGALIGLAAAQRFAAEPSRRAFVAVQSTEGERVWNGGWSAFVKTVAAECPGAAVKCLDIAARDPAVAADALVAELRRGGDAVEVSLAADGARFAVVDEPARAPNENWRLPDNAALVVSGGGRGVTALCLEALARKQSLRLLILGRTARVAQSDIYLAKDRDARSDLVLAEARRRGETLAPKELKRRLDAVEAAIELEAGLAALGRAGAEVEYVALDIADAAAVREATARMRRQWGRLDGFVHGAGLLADRRLADKTPLQFSAVYRTKVFGLRALLEATRDDDLKLIALFSSIAGRRGNVGQIDYAMANALLDRAAISEAARRGANCNVRSLAWSPWDGGMVDAGLKAHFAAQGVPLIAPDAGVAAFLAEIAAGPDGGAAVTIAAARAGG